MNEALLYSELPDLPPPRRGKVRDVYDLGEYLLIVASDRISAYDHVLRPGIPDKGKILTQLSTYWFERLGSVLPHHLVATEVNDFPRRLAPHREVLRGRSVLVRKARVVPFECVARGYLAGSGFKDYRQTGEVCGIPLPAGLRRADRLPEAIFTPATKAEEGHDENVGFAALESALGTALAERLRSLTLELYRLGAEHAAGAGLLLADTKFEFGLSGASAADETDSELLLIDEALTPDSSRYWPADRWTPGEEPVSVDKQYVRNWLDKTGWDHQGEPPQLAAEVVEGTRERYLEAFRRLTGGEPRL